MSAPPALAPPAAPVVTGPSAVGTAHGAAGTNHAAAGTSRGASGTSAAAATHPAAADGAGAVIAFELILEAQLGLPALKTVAGADAAEAPAAAPAAGAQPVDALLLLSAGLPASQVIAADPAARAEPSGAAAARHPDSSQLLQPLLPAANAAAMAAQTAEPAPFAAPIAVAHDGESRAPVPASIAAALQALPATGDAARYEAEPPAPAPNAAAPLAPAPAERRADAAPAAQHPAAPLPGTVGEPRWGNALSQRVVWMVGQQMHSARFRVEPPQLGPIEVRLSIVNEQASLTFLAPHAAARDAIQTALPRLQEMLLESGVSLGSVFVGSQAPQDQRESRASGKDAGVASVPSEVQAASPAAAPLRRVVGLVDLYA
jgi:flagellar hook-length control protein FliK